MILKRDRGKADAYLHVDGRDIEEPKELALKWDREIASWKIAGDAEEYRISELRRAILQVLEHAGEPMTPTEVADVLDKPANTVRQRMWQMSKEGRLTSADGKYVPNNRNVRNPYNHSDSNTQDEQSEVA
jgi:hypothetical protein